MGGEDVDCVHRQPRPIHEGPDYAMAGEGDIDCPRVVGGGSGGVGESCEVGEERGGVGKGEGGGGEGKGEGVRAGREEVR